MSHGTQRYAENPPNLGFDTRILDKSAAGNSIQCSNFPVALVVGIIVCLGGVFITLAAYQVIPHGINALSNVGIWGHVAGYGTMGLGLVIVLVGGIRLHLSRKANTPKEKEAVRLPVAIAEGVTKTLDPLFPGGVASIPGFPKMLKDWPKVEDMDAPIMKGYFCESDEQILIPFIAVKMLCMNTRDEIIEKLGIQWGQFHVFAAEVLVLYQSKDEEPLIWVQRSGENAPKLYPNFFTDDITCSDGQVARNQQENFTLLQNIILNGEGKDAKGIDWKLLRKWQSGS